MAFELSDRSFKASTPNGESYAAPHADGFQSLGREALQACLMHRRGTGAEEDVEAFQSVDILAQPLGHQKTCQTNISIEITLSPNAYSLVLASRSPWAILPMIITSCAQLAVLWAMGLRSHGFFFSEGEWHHPLMGSQALFVIKVFSLFLILFQIADEFDQAGKIFRLLGHESWVKLSAFQTASAWYAVITMYLTSLVVLFFALHIIESSRNLIEPLWKTFYATMTLEFDNAMCKVFLYGLDSSKLTWSFTREHTVDDLTFRGSAGREEQFKRTAQKRTRDLIFFVLPAIFAFLAFGMSIIWDVCPLTYCLYGHVSNMYPVHMLSSMYGLPGECCGVSAELAHDKRSVQAHVPCLYPSAKWDGGYPIIYWALWPVERPAPTSLQVYIGGGGGYTLVQHGSVTSTLENSMARWLEKRGYEKDVYQAMIDDAGSVVLYRKMFAYVAEWSIDDLPDSGRFQIYAVGLNPDTRALSPFPLSSVMLEMGGGRCPTGCRSCTTKGVCLNCDRGWRLSRTKNECHACDKNCNSCFSAGPGKCSENSCKADYGLAGSICLPCQSQHCAKCGAAPGNIKLSYTNHSQVPDGQVLPCWECMSGYSLHNGSCYPCSDVHCDRCELPNWCDKCVNGFGTTNNGTHQVCYPCPAFCNKCDDAQWLEKATLQCTRNDCADRHTLDAGTCVECPPHCTSCETPTTCDGGCQLGFGLQNKKYLEEKGRPMSFWHKCNVCKDPNPELKCRKCIDNCDVCETEPHKCDDCSAGYGITPSSTCHQCSAHCKDCSVSDDCRVCDEGFVLKDEACHSCSDQCMSCDVLGPRKCNHCKPGWTRVKDICMPCVDPGCIRCEPEKFKGKCCEWDDGTTDLSIDCGS